MKKTDSKGQVEQTAYDATGNISQLIDAQGQTFTYIYHPTWDWLIQCHTPDTGDTVN